MRTMRRAVSLLLLLPAAALLACEQGPPAPDGPDADAQADAAAGETPAPSQIALEPENPDELVAATEGGEWGQFWNELVWDVSEDFDGKVRVWGVLVEDGERTKTFLTEPRTPEGTGPADTYAPPPSLHPAPDTWEPGNEWVRGEQWLPENSTEALPPVAAFFEGDEWRPPVQENFNPRKNFVVNGIIDGIYDQGPGADVAGDVKTQVLVIPFAAEISGSAKFRGGGILIGYTEAP